MKKISIDFLFIIYFVYNCKKSFCFLRKCINRKILSHPNRHKRETFEGKKIEIKSIFYVKSKVNEKLIKEKLRNITKELFNKIFHFQKSCRKYNTSNTFHMDLFFLINL